MDNLYRELAPISAAAWTDLEEEARRTFQRHVAGRRIVDVAGPEGFPLAAVGTGHLQPIDAPSDGVIAQTAPLQPIVELRVPFTVDRQQVDDVERGAKDADWQPAKDAARSSPSPRIARSSRGTRPPASPAFAPVRPTRRSSSRRRCATTPPSAGPACAATGRRRRAVHPRPRPTPTPRSASPPTRAIRSASTSTDAWWTVRSSGHRPSKAPAAVHPRRRLRTAPRPGCRDRLPRARLQTVQLYLQETLTFLALTAEASVSLPNV